MSLTFSADGELAVRPVNIAFHFTLLIGLETIGDFQAIEGISFSQGIKTYNEGGRNHSPHLLRWDGPAQRGEVTLRWGMMTRAALYQWSMAVERGYIFRKPVYILQLDRDKAPMRLIALFSAFPKQWRMGSLDANSNNWSVEEVVLAYEDIGMIALNESMLDALGGLVGNFFNTGLSLNWEEDGAIDWETSNYEQEELEAFEEIDYWDEEQRNIEYLLRNWDSLSPEDRAAFMEENGITTEDLEQYATVNETDLPAEPEEGEEEDGFFASTPSGTSLEEVEEELDDGLTEEEREAAFLAVNTGGRREEDFAEVDPTAGTIGGIVEEAEAEDGEAEEDDDAPAVPRAFSTRGTGGSSLFDAEAEREEAGDLSGFDETGSGGLSLADAEAALEGADLSGFDEENLGGLSLEDAESELGEDSLSAFGDDEESAAGDEAGTSEEEPAEEEDANSDDPAGA